MRIPLRTLALVVGLLALVPLTSVGAADIAPDRGTEAIPPRAEDPVDEALRREAEGSVGPLHSVATTAPLTGEQLDEDRLAELEDRPAAIVKIPNNELAHPHRGLERADVVYEQETEGGTTRFAAVFHSHLPEVVGNVRSARPVDIPLVAPYRGVFVYAGARAEVLEMVEDAQLTSVGAGGPGYFTDPARNAPHHLYTRLPDALAERDAPAPPTKPWRFDEQPPDGGRVLDGRLRILMSSIAATSWEWDPEAGVFRRFQNDRPHRVTGPDRIGAANVVVLDVEVSGRDSAGAPVYELDGEGEAWLLRDGRVFEIGWEKRAVTGQLRLVDGTDRAVLAPGPTWILLTYDGVLASLEEQLEDEDR